MGHFKVYGKAGVKLPLDQAMTFLPVSISASFLLPPIERRIEVVSVFVVSLEMPLAKWEPCAKAQ